MVIAFQWTEGRVVRGTLFFITAAEDILEDVVRRVIQRQRDAEKAHKFEKRKQIFALNIFKNGSTDERVFVDWYITSVGLSSSFLPPISNRTAGKMTSPITGINIVCRLCCCICSSTDT